MPVTSANHAAWIETHPYDNTLMEAIIRSAFTGDASRAKQPTEMTVSSVWADMDTTVPDYCSVLANFIKKTAFECSRLCCGRRSTSWMVGRKKNSHQKCHHPHTTRCPLSPHFLQQVLTCHSPGVAHTPGGEIQGCYSAFCVQVHGVCSQCQAQSFPGAICR